MFSSPIGAESLIRCIRHLPRRRWDSTQQRHSESGRVSGLVVVSLLVSFGLLGFPVDVAHGSTCSLPGSGTAENPWEVDSLADFRLVADSPCLATGYYRQTGNLTGFEMLTSYTDHVAVPFMGTYDGDHYTIELGGSSVGGWADSTMQTEVLGLFKVLGGVVKKLNLTGTLHSHTGSNSFGMGTLVHSMFGGLVSEVNSNVQVVKSSGSQKLNVGGLVGVVAKLTGPGLTSRVQHSSFTGSVEWSPLVAAGQTDFGGLVERAAPGEALDIRDSYASYTLNVNRPGDATAELDIGGLLGSADTEQQVRIIRSYAVPRTTLTGGLTNVYEGGLVGWQFNAAQRIYVSVFWLVDDAPTAIGRFFPVGTSQPATYLGGLPVAVPLSESLLQTLSSYQTREGSAGEPGGDDLVVAASTGTLAEQDYRWAIEPGDVAVFIPSHYTTESNFLTRQLYTDTAVARTYQTRGTNLE